jgi:hypothetical protein
MDWIQFLGAFSIGALVIKLLDIFLLQRRSIEHDHLKWIREKKYEAYSLLSQDILSMGFSRKNRTDPFEGYKNASKSILLLNDNNLAHRINTFIVELDRLYSITDKPDYKIESDELYKKLYNEARQLVMDLHNDLLSTKYR